MLVRLIEVTINDRRIKCSPHILQVPTIDLNNPTDREQYNLGEYMVDHVELLFRDELERLNIDKIEKFDYKIFPLLPSDLADAVVY
jgi:hypothetical protein